MELIAARFFIAKAGFNVETQAVLNQSPDIGGFVTHDEPGVIRLVKQASQSQVDWPHSDP